VVGKPERGRKEINKGDLFDVSRCIPLTQGGNE
jgi:hypothetical protein